MKRIVKFIILDILKNKIILFYTVLLSILSWSVFSLEDNNTKGLLSLLNVVLLTVPLFAIVFSTIYLYNSAEFIELLLSQPIRRSKIWSSLFLGLTLSLLLAYFIGAGIPILIYSPPDVGFMMLIVGFFVSTVFVSLAFLASIITRDKAKGIGISILLWLFFTLLFDGLILFMMFQLVEYPIEKMMVVFTAFNPVDLSRILILLHLDVSVMLGYTGAVFKDLFGTKMGLFFAFIVLLLWVIVPFYISLIKFKNKDL